MDFEEIIKKRKSIKVFQDKKIAPNLINKIIELSNLSPSAGNIQARSVIIVKNNSAKKELCIAAFNKEWMMTSPVILVILANLKESEEKYQARGRNLYALQDATIFASYAQLVAFSLGLYSRWVGNFNEEEVKKTLGIKDDKRPICIMPIGYPAEEPKIKPRKSLSELVFKEI